MKKQVLFIIFAGILFLGIIPSARAVPSVSCDNPVAQAVLGGGVVNINILCTISNISPGINTLTPSGSNIVAPPTIILTNGGNTLSAALQSTITSPDGTVTQTSGLPLLGFIGVLTAPTSKIQFQYQTTTTPATHAGSYVSTVGAMTFNWQVTGIPGGIASGTANSTLQVNVPAPPTFVSCNSPGVSAPSGGGPYTINVNCTISNDGSTLSPGASNTFSPALLTLSQGANNLTANLQAGVSSPDGTVTGIAGTASGGFTGTIQSLPATIRVQYTGSTTSTTPSGTYTSGTITYIWSAI